MIISNNCAAGFFLKENNIKYDNPFIFSRVAERDILNFIANYDTINYNNVKWKLEYCYSTASNKFCWEPSVLAKLDDLIDIHYVHYIKSDVDDHPKVDNFSIYHKDIVNLIKEKYKNRIARMKNKNLGIIIFHDRDYCEDSALMNLIHVCNEKKIKLIIFTDPGTRKNINPRVNTEYVKFADLKGFYDLNTVIRDWNNFMTEFFKECM